MNSRCKTMVLLSPAFPANESETSWVTTQQLFVRILKEQNPSLRVVVLSFYYPDQLTSYEWKQVEVIPFNGRKYPGPRHLFFLWRIWRQLRKIRRTDDVIGLFSFWYGECALIGRLFGKWHRIRHYCWLCGQDAREHNKIVRWSRPDPGELIAMSDFLVEEFYRNHKVRPAFMIPNAIDPALFGVLAPSVRDIDLLGAGTLSALKQYDLFIHAAASIRQCRGHIRAMVCGDGDQKEALLGLIRELGMGNSISLQGQTPHSEVLQLMQRTKVFLHTSNYEGFGVVCLEALYAGAHVISFCRPLREDVPNWHIAGDLDEMIQKARELLSDPATKHEPILSYTMDNTVKAVMELFKT